MNKRRFLAAIAFMLMCSVAQADTLYSGTAGFNSLNTNTDDDFNVFNYLVGGAEIRTRTVGTQTTLDLVLNLTWKATTPDNPVLTDLYIFDGILSGSTLTISDSDYSVEVPPNNFDKALLNSLKKTSAWGGTGLDFSPSYKISGLTSGNLGLDKNETLTLTFQTIKDTSWLAEMIDDLGEPTIFDANNQLTGKIMLMGHVQRLGPTQELSEFVYSSPFTPAVPTPSSFAALLGMGAVGMIAAMRRRWKRSV